MKVVVQYSEPWGVEERSFNFPSKDRSLIRRWVKALRSGEYKQGQGALKENINWNEEKKPKWRHCCLGVLGEIQKVKAKELNDTNLHSKKIPRYLRDGGALDQHCVKMNDEDGRSFGYIANWLEKNLLKRKK